MKDWIEPAAPVRLPVRGGGTFAVRRIYCVGRNYAEHAREMGFTGREPPFFFMKPGDACVPVPSGTVVDLPYPTLTQDLHPEVELVVAVGRGGRNISADDALTHVFGYAVGLDMTRRDLQAEMKKQGRPWCIAKGFDASAPTGAITRVADAGEWRAAEIALQVNGQRRQHGRIADLIWTVPEILAQLSAAWTLQPGDLVFTGTPAGVGPVNRGDLLEGTVTGLDGLSVRIV